MKNKISLISLLFLTACSSSSISYDKNSTAQDLVDYLNNVPGKEYGFQVDWKNNYPNYHNMPSRYKDGSNSFWLVKNFDPGLSQPEAIIAIDGTTSSSSGGKDFNFYKMPSIKLAKQELEKASMNFLCIARGYWLLCGYSNNHTGTGLTKKDMIKLFSDF